MTLNASTRHDRSGQPRPTCPFCDAPWTDDMLDLLDSMTGSTSCGCCAPGLTLARWPIPTRDLCCEACGKAIYLKV